MVSEQTREEDERLREELRHVDLEKLKTVIKPLLSGGERQKEVNTKKRKRIAR
jgi:ABC-type nitrate/sulfonate/bicarbonate transport system ATPase subunit